MSSSTFASGAQPRLSIAHRADGTAPRDTATAVAQAVRGLRILALRWSPGPEEAEDLLQDTVERALRKLHRHRPGTNVRAWVRAIMYHLAVDRSRYRRREALARTAFEHVAVEEDEPAPPEPPPLPPMEEVRASVDRLTEPYRTAFRLWALERRSYREISRLEGIPVGTVGTRLLRARAQLRHLLIETAPTASGGDQEPWGPGPT
jgi:RNA polymerase sigma-70 factor, ECF subfamily